MPPDTLTPRGRAIIRRRRIDAAWALSLCILSGAIVPVSLTALVVVATRAILPLIGV